MLAMWYDKWLAAVLPVIHEAEIPHCQSITEAVKFKHTKNYTEEILWSKILHHQHITEVIKFKHIRNYIEEILSSE